MASAWRFPYLTLLALLALLGIATVATIAPECAFARLPVAVACSVAAARPTAAARAALLARLRGSDDATLGGFARWWRSAATWQRRAIAKMAIEASRPVPDPDWDVVYGDLVAQDPDQLVLVGLVASDRDELIAAPARAELASLLLPLDEGWSCRCGSERDDGVVAGLGRLARDERLRLAPVVAQAFARSNFDRELPACADFLRRCMREDPDPARRRDVLATLGVAGDRFIGDEVWTAWTRGDLPHDVLEQWLAFVADPQASPAIAAMMHDARGDVREAAAAAAMRLGDPRLFPDLMALADDPQPRVRGCALVALASLRDPRAVPAFARALADEDPVQRLLAVDAAAAVPGAEALAVVAAARDDACPIVAEAARRSWCARGDAP